MSTGRCKNKLPTHKIINVDFTNTNPWYKNKKDITVTVDLLLPEESTVSMAINLQHEELSIDEELIRTEYESKTHFVFVIPYKKLNAGDNIVTLTFSFKDSEETPEEVLTYTETIKVETRDDFYLERAIKYNGEYIVSGQLKLDADKKLHIEKQGQGFAISRNFINMDGKHSISNVAVSAPNDTYININILQEPLHYEDKEEYAVYKIPLKKIASYYAIDNISLMTKE